MSDTMKNNVDQEKEDQSRFSMREFKQQNQNDVISFTKISRLLFKTQMNKKKHLFMMLSLIIDNRFHKHQVNSLNKLSMITALELSYESQFMTRNNDKWLKLTASTNILEDVHSEKLQTMLKIWQLNVQKLICQFENYEESEKKLWRSRIHKLKQIILQIICTDLTEW